MDFLLLPEQPDQPGRYWTPGEGGALHETLLTAADGPRRAVVFVPTSQCLLSSVQVSAAQWREAREALAWLIEDQLAEDPEQLHVVAGPRSEEGGVPILAVGRAVFEHWRERLHALNVTPLAVLPDLLLVPHGTGWSLQLTPTQACLRLDAWRGLCVEPAALPAVIAAALVEQPPAVAQVQLYADPAEPLTELTATLEQAGLTVVRHPLYPNAPATDALWSRHPFNLLQGDYRPADAGHLSPRWRRLGLLALMAFGLLLANEAGRMFWLNWQAKKLETANRQQYQQLFPQERRVVNLRRQLEAHLNSAGASQGEFLPLLTVAAESIDAQGGRLSATRVHFSERGLELDVAASGFDAIQQLQQMLQARGQVAELLSSDQQGSQIKARLRLGEAS